MIRTLLVDDEPLALELMHSLLTAHDDIEIVGAFRSGSAALGSIAKLQPDLMFLDIQMPGMSGFDLISQIPSAQMPQIVFATAFDSYAVDAFNIHALDYLLKPIDPHRLSESLQRLRDNQRLREETEEFVADAQKGRLMTALGSLPGAQTKSLEPAGVRADKKLAVRDGQQTQLIPYEDIDWIDAAGDYMCIHAKGLTHIMRCTMKQLEDKLQDPRFARIHRSTLVNLTRVQSVSSLGKGESMLHLPNGIQLKVSRNYREALVDYLD